jgi:hypothetical protein
MTEYVAQLEAAGPFYPVVSFNGLWLLLCKIESEPDNTFEEYLIDVLQIRHKNNIN